MDNIGQIVLYAASDERHFIPSQAYLWCISRLDMSKFVERSIIARRTPDITRMVLTEFEKFDRLPSGLFVYTAIKRFMVCQMISRVLRSTFVYIRHKKDNTFQIIIEWNGIRRYPESLMQNYWEEKMSDAYSNEQNMRMGDLMIESDSYYEEMIEENHERWADENQIRRILDRDR